MEIKIPEVGESVREALVAKWFKKDGEQVAKDEPVCELETDKITLDLHAEAAGVLTILVAEGATVPIGTVVGTVAESAGEVAAPRAEEVVPAAPPIPLSPLVQREGKVMSSVSSPSVRRLMREEGIDPEAVEPGGAGGRITLEDLFSRIEENSRRKPVQLQPEPLPDAPSPQPVRPEPLFSPAPLSAPHAVHSEESPRYTAAPLHDDAGRVVERVAMSPIRRRIAERLLAARQQTAMLTTFSEVDMGAVMEIRGAQREEFMRRHGVKLGYMSLFVRACCRALTAFPSVNAAMDGDDIVYHRYCDIGVAVGAEKGLVVPVIRSAEALRLHEIERAIGDLAEKVRSNRLAISDLEGGTFTISNGGIYGSMLSTPIINPPQSAVLGMHAIQERPVVRDGQVVVRPMMYLALSYDHRLIDGREAVSFLKAVKEFIEQPALDMQEE